MICNECQENNNYNALYCKKCGAAFSQEQRDNAYSQTWMSKVDRIEDLIEILKLGKITGNKFVRIGIIAVLMFLCVGNIMSNGTKLMIMDTPKYDVEKVSQDEYILTSSYSSFGLDVSIPFLYETIEVSIYDENGVLVSEQEYISSQDIIITNDTSLTYSLTVIGEYEEQTLNFCVKEK